MENKACINKPKILLVDDRAENILALKKLLTIFDIEIFTANEGNDALSLMLQNEFFAVLLDVQMPGMDGFEVAELMKENETLSHYPIIFVTAISKEDKYVNKAHKLGAVDYLFKPIDPVILESKISVFLDQYKQRLEMSHVMAELKIMQAELEKSNNELKKLAHFDNLTRLPNRSQFEKNIRQTISRSKRNEQMFGVFFLDLDNFKTINDSLGHQIGDLLLQHVAKRITFCLREEDTVSRTGESNLIARLGGDEFAVVLQDIRSAHDAGTIAERLINDVNSITMLEGHEVNVGVSLGIACYPTSGTTPEQLIKHADIAMYRAKEKGRNNYQFYSTELNVVHERRQLFEGQLRSALEKDEFTLLYQPIINMKSEKCIGVEALIRWHNSELGFVSPMEFIEVAEDLRLIGPIGDWVMKTACQQLNQWLTQGYDVKKFSINLSTRQLLNKELPRLVAEQLKQYSIPEQLLELEITETAIMDDVDATEVILKQLSDIGCRLSIDDFGTGYSSLSRLKTLPINTLKIDQSFVRDLLDDDDDATIVKSIIALAKGLGLDIVAEGIENKEQLEFLQANGCHMGQGYYFAKPSDPSVIEEMLNKKEP